MNTALRSALLFGTLGAALSASAQNLVTNPGFETGDFSGWTQGGDTGFTGVQADAGVGYAHSGNYGAYFGNRNPGTLSQTLATVAGRTYTVGFWLRNETDATNPLNAFSVAFGGQTLGTVTDPAFTAYRQFSFTATAASTSTLLQLTYQHPPSYFDLDDVSVVANPVPEPASLAALSLGAVALLRRRRK